MELIARAAVMYVVLWTLVRATGKRELAEMSSFEMVLLIVLGDVVQQAITQEDMSITGAVLAAGTLTLIVVATSYVAFRSKRFRSGVEGVPVIVISNGKLNQPAMRLERLTVEEIHSEARQHGIASIEQIRIGVLEADGRFSFITNEPETDVDAHRQL